MDLKQITETFEKFVETQIEYVDEVVAIKEGTYEGGHVDKLVLANLDDFSEDELIRVLENYDYYNHQDGGKLFPSGWIVEYGPYPAKLASALAKSKENESITDVYNIFYRNHGDLETWGEAGEVWKKDCLENFDKVEKTFEWAALSGEEAADYINDIANGIAVGYPDFAEAIKNKLLK